MTMALAHIHVAIELTSIEASMNFVITVNNESHPWRDTGPQTADNVKKKLY